MKNKRVAIASMILSLVGICLPAVAQFSGMGSGTPGSPYQVANAQQLDEMRNNLDAHYILEQDIDLSTATGPGGAFYDGGAGWEPIGTLGSGFTGSLDGDGYVITGMFIARSGDYFVGLFGDLWPGGSVSDLGVEAADVTGDQYVGILAGYSEGTVTGSYATGTVNARTAVGGLVGRTGSGSSITGSYSGASVSGDFAGGLVGDNYGSISESYATGSVSGSYYVGGLAGSNDGSVTDSYATGSVSGSGGNVGGLVGENFAAISASYWNTETSGQEGGVGDGSATGMTGLTSAEMRRVASFGGFDFTDTWQIDEYLSFPTLQDNPQDPAPGFAFADGDGTSGTPYEITTSAQLDAIRGDLDAHYILTEDIELSTATGSGGVFYHGGAGWEPIGENGDEFTGSLDGNGHTISGLYIDRSGDDYVGLFGSLGSGSSVSDLGVEEADVTGDRHVGILVGETDGSITGSYATGEVSGNNRVGGLVGITSSSGSSITGSYSGASVSGGDWVGGLVGSTVMARFLRVTPRLR
ncbi:MAG: GLUG motif-containing protein [Balneolaceae bacterium]|nr:GLUG motif-containing protein [Balneolaceae bacterium]